MREGQSQILKGQKMDQILTGGAAIATAVAAVFGLLAATTKVHDNIDRFMIDLERQGRLACCRGVSALPLDAAGAVPKAEPRRLTGQTKPDSETIKREGATNL